MGAGFEDDCRSVVAADLDADGKQDLAVVSHQWQPGAEVTPKQALYLLRNRMPDAAGTNWLGVHLDGAKGISPVGADVVLETSAGTRSKLYMTGDSFYAQHPATAHFGMKLQEGEIVERLRVRWPGGRETLVEAPALRQYHRVRAPD